MPQKSSEKNSASRFIGIELLRWSSAIGILFWHYQHFFYTKAIHGDSFQDYESMPFYSILHPIYMNGAKGVQLFWAISGFVIFHNYGHSKINILSFARNRFARLYPLHLLTLFLVASLQLVSTLLFANPQIYFDNTIRNFFMHFLFISGWEANPSLSFNQPVWSVSLEILVYAIFALLLLVKTFRQNAKWLWSTILVGTFIFVNFKEVHAVFHCLLFFSLGATLRCFLNQLGNKATFVSTIILFITLLDKYFLRNYLENFGDNNEFNSHLILLFQISALIVISINLDRMTFIQLNKEKIQVLGNLTYGTYLLHVPFQISLLLIIKQIGLPVLALAQNPFSLFAYLLAVNFFAFFAYRHIELPCNIQIKNFQFRA
jgi:peptidoglycan/LPS O-acetylase OafA/YrhL